jgi:hypothetical protein
MLQHDDVRDRSSAVHPGEANGTDHRMIAAGLGARGAIIA